MKLRTKKDEHLVEIEEIESADSDSDYNPPSDTSLETCDFVLEMWDKEDAADGEDWSIGFNSDDETSSSVHSTGSSISSNNGKNDFQDLHQWAEESEGESSDGSTSEDVDKFEIPTTNAGKC
jgi:hypothetical protein